jgi:hypothetical protein
MLAVRNLLKRDNALLKLCNILPLKLYLLK